MAYLENVMNHQEAIPMRRYAGSTGRTAQGEFCIFELVEENLARAEELRYKYWDVIS